MGAVGSYVNPTAVLVALELRHPDSGPIFTPAQAKLKQVLAAHLPLSRPITTSTLQAGTNTVPEFTSETSPRFLNRDRTVSVTYRTSAVQIETTQYKNYEDFRKLIRLATVARQEIGQIDGIERLGIRYINEIRAPDAGPDLGSWEPWVNPKLLGPASFGDPRNVGPTKMQALVSYQINASSTLALRYGVTEGYAVDPAGELRRPTPPPAAFFLIDIDSFWLATSEVPEFSEDGILAECDRLHGPVRELFDTLTTDRLKKEVLRER